MLGYRLLALLLFVVASPWGAGQVVVIEGAETAGISGFRAYWDRPVPLAADGATRLKDHGRFGGGHVADWSTDAPGALAFDAVQRSLLVRFPAAAEVIAAKLREGARLRQAVLILPFRDTEYFPLDYDMPAGMSFLGDTWVKEPPRWHAQAWLLRRPWTAHSEHGPTYNAAVNGRVYWRRYGATDETTDRYPKALGPAEVSREVPLGRMDLTACLSDPAYGATLEARLRQFADCGLLIGKWELYDARYWKGGYEWGVATGQRAILIDAPRLELTFEPGEPQALVLPPAADPAALPPQGAPTAVVPNEAAFAGYAEAFAFTRPESMADWQWQRLQELRALGGGRSFVESYDGYLKWLDGMLSLHPRAWKGFSAGEMAAEYAMYREAIPAPVQDNLRRYWWAWLMPDRPYESLVHGYIGGQQAREYYEKSGDWRGNFSVYRTYLHSMGTVNFNSWATTGAMFGGWIIGDDGVMAEARRGYDHWMTRTWTWMDGTSQESIDHYYFAHTLGPLKTIADFAPGPSERLAGRLNVEKHVDELIACWHPNLRRFISSSGRTGVAYPLYLQDGLSYIVHTLSPDGALTDVGAAPVAERKEGAFSREFAPGQVALQARQSPWASAAAAALVDRKPLPYRAIRSYVQWGSYTETPIWKKSYLGTHYGLASLDVTQNETVPVMAQWRRNGDKVTGWRDLGTLLARYGINDTEFLDSLWHGTTQRNPNGSVGVQGGPTVTVQGDNSAIILASPVPDLKLGGHGRPVPAEIHSLQLSLALFNFEDEPTWRIFVDGQPVTELPVRARFGQRITIQDGVTYLGIVPLPATELGNRDTEVLISAKGEPTEMQGGGKIKVTLTIDACNYRSDTPLAADAPGLDQAVAGYVVQLGDATEHASFAAFQQWFAALPCTARWDAAEGVYHVAYGPPETLLEAGFNPTAPLAQPTTQVFPYRRFKGEWPYLAPGVHRDTTTAIQSANGRLEKNGATLTVKAGTMAYLQAFPEQDVYVAMNPYLEPVLFRFELPGGVVVEADGQLGQARVEVHPATRQIDLSYAGAPDGADGAATALRVTGMAQPPTVRLNGQPLTPIADANGYRLPLATD